MIDIETTLNECDFGEAIGDECHKLIQKYKVWKIVIQSVYCLYFIKILYGNRNF